ncbi:MAG: hypothetical protein JST00_47750 [Deltaproteobacteria bacterium]|nr:hypothetical protein [Deltaproteobacteria bacterium]
MDASPFATILGQLLERLPGAYACSLVDQEGETVDYAGLGDPFDTKIAAAHVRILMQQLEELRVLGTPRSIVIRGSTRSIVGRALPEGYALVVILRKRAGFTRSDRAYDACTHALALEAGWATTSGAPKLIWHPVRVELDRRGRPRVVSSPDRSVDVANVLGAVVGLPRREKGFRVRLSTGSEITLVREPGNSWFSDDFLG